MHKDSEDKKESKLKKYVEYRQSYMRAAIIPYLFVAYPIAGVLLGWWLDKWLNTSPWLLMVFLILGFVEAVREMMVIGKSVEREMERDQKKKEEKD